jgi:putative membrane protein
MAAVNPGLPALVLAGLAYAVRARTLARRGRPVPPARFLAFSSGLFLIVVALAAPLENSFAAHMAQHLVLGDLGAILVVLGLNGPLLRPLLSLPGAGRLRGLAHPAVAVLLWAANLYLWHLPPLFDAALEHETLHGLQHGCFFAAGALLWAALLEPLPGPAWFGAGSKALVVVLVGAAAAALANVFIWSGRVFYERYDSVTDQRVGGAIMLLEGIAVTLTAFACFFLRWMRETEARQRLVEEGQDPLTAARSVRYGRIALK